MWIMLQLGLVKVQGPCIPVCLEQPSFRSHGPDMIINSAHPLSKVAEFGPTNYTLTLLEYLYSLLQNTQQTGL